MCQRPFTRENIKFPSPKHFFYILINIFDWANHAPCVPIKGSFMRVYIDILGLLHIGFVFYGGAADIAMYRASPIERFELNVLSLW